MSTLKSIWNCMFSPKLIRIYGNETPKNLYEPNSMERWGDTVIHSLYVIWKIGVYTSPLLVGILYHRGYFESASYSSLTKLMTSVGVILVVSFCFRGLSRAGNPTYMKFLTTLQSAQSNLTSSVKKELNMYDFEFYAWPVEYSLKTRDVRKQIVVDPSENMGLVKQILHIPYKVIAYVAIHTFGIKIVYPGSFGFLNLLLEQSLIQGRTRMVEQFGGERFKLRTSERNEIDTMFIDRRNKSTNGSTLVICCEGNAGFYEIGITITPIETGYSVLGWNHPGFGGSTGTPYPSQEQSAIDTVIQFAINKLNFKLENIIFFGWSIGGYTSTWAAMNYPDCKGIILDATFDDIMPLAVNYMPTWWEPIVQYAIRRYVNLNIYEQLAEYSGPIYLVRRTDDEVICLREGDISSNRGNHLLAKLLRHRYPYIMEEPQILLLREYLAVTANTQDEFLSKHSVDEVMCQSLLQSYISEYSKSYPMKIGEDFNNKQKNDMTLFLARKYMRDFKSTHCTNLPTDMFQVPWDVVIESDFVFT